MIENFIKTGTDAIDMLDRMEEAMAKGECETRHDPADWLAVARNYNHVMGAHHAEVKAYITDRGPYVVSDQPFRIDDPAVVEAIANVTDIRGREGQNTPVEPLTGSTPTQPRLTIEQRLARIEKELGLG